MIARGREPASAARGGGLMTRSDHPLPVRLGLGTLWSALGDLLLRAWVLDHDGVAVLTVRYREGRNRANGGLQRAAIPHATVDVGAIGRC